MPTLRVSTYDSRSRTAITGTSGFAASGVMFVGTCIQHTQDRTYTPDAIAISLRLDFTFAIWQNLTLDPRVTQRAYLALIHPKHTLFLLSLHFTV